MTVPQRYNTIDNQRSTLSHIFEESLQHHDITEMILLLGMMPLNDINLEALTKWGDIGSDLILKTPRLHEHPAYSKFVRTYFCEACRELNLEQFQRFIPYATESDQLEGFLLLLLENVNRTVRVFPKVEKNLSIHDLMNEISSTKSSTNTARLDMLAFLIEHVSSAVLEQVSHTINLHVTTFSHLQTYHSTIRNGVSQKIQHEILKRAAEDAARNHNSETLSKRKM